MATALGWDDGWKSDTVALFILWCGAVLQLFSLKIHTDGGLIFSKADLVSSKSFSGSPVSSLTKMEVSIP